MLLLLLSDFRSVESIVIAKKFDFKILILYQSQVLKWKVVALLLNVAVKPIDQSHSNSISGVVLQNTSSWFLVFHLPLKLRVVHINFCLMNMWYKFSISVYPLGTIDQSIRLAVNNWKMPGTSQSTVFIFQSVKLHLCQAAGNTLINTEGKSKLSNLKEFLVCFRLLQK